MAITIREKIRESFYEMQLHDVTTIDFDLHVTARRVPGGWIYTQSEKNEKGYTIALTATFVPLNREFMSNELRIYSLAESEKLRYRMKADKKMVKESEAHTRLVTVAPELLEACKVSEITLRDIAKRHESNSFHNNRVYSDAEDALKILEAAIKAAESEVKHES